MAASFPVTFPSALSVTGTQTLQDVGHTDNLHVKDRDEIIAAQTKLGLGSSVASGTTALLGTGGTQSAWGQITNAYISGTAAISVSKLAPASANGSVLTTAAGTATWALLTNDNIAGTAAIAVSKLGTVTASRPLVSNAGGTLAAGTITTDMIAANAVTSAPVSIVPGPQSTTASGTLVAMSNGTVSFTTSAVNGPVWVFGRARLSSTASGAIIQYLYRGGTIFQELVVQTLAAGESCPVGVVVQLPTLAASTTYEFSVYWYGPGGTTTWSDGVFSFVEFKK